MPGENLRVHLRLTADGKGFSVALGEGAKELDKLKKETTTTAVETKKLNTETTGAAVATKRLAKETTGASAATNKLTQSVRRNRTLSIGQTRALKNQALAAEESKRRTDSLQRSTARLNSSYRSGIRLVGALAGGFTLAVLATRAARATLQAADSYTELNNRLRLVVASERELINTRGDLLRISLDTRTALSSNAQLYSRLSQSATETARSEEDLLRVTELLNKQVLIGGNNAREASAGLIQFGQGISSGKLQGDELRSVLENLLGVTNGLIFGFRRLREEGKISFDVTRGNLRDLAAEGTLTSELLLDAVLASGDNTERKFRQVDITVSGALTNIGSSALIAVGNLNEAYGLTESLANSINAIANGNVDEGLGILDEAFLAIAIISLTRYTASLNLSTRASAGLAKTTAVLRAGVLRKNQVLAVNAAQLNLGSAAAITLSRRYRALNASALVLQRTSSSLLAVLGGWPGALLLGGFAISQLIERINDAKQPSEDLANVLERIARERDGLAAVAGVAGEDELNLTISANAALTEAQGYLDGLIELDKKLAARGNFYVDTNGPEREENIEIAREAIRRLTLESEDALTAFQEALRASRTAPSDGIGLGTTLLSEIEKLIPDSDSAAKPFDDLIETVEAQREKFRGYLYSGDSRLVTAARAGIAEADSEIAKLSTARTTALDNENKKEIANIERIEAYYATERERIADTYRKNLSAINQSAEGGGDVSDLRGRALSRRDADLQKVGQREEQELARREADLVNARRREEEELNKNGTAALMTLTSANRALSNETDLSRHAIDRRNEAAERELELQRSFPEASAATLTALRDSYAEQGRLLDQQERKAGLLERFSSTDAIREQHDLEISALQELLDSGAILQAEYREAEQVLELEHEQTLIDARLDLRRAGWEQELLERQGFTDREQEAELEHRRALIEADTNYFDATKKVATAAAEFESTTGARRVKAGLQVAEESFAALAAHSVRAFKLQQAAGIASAIVSTYVGAAAALKEGPIIGPILAAVQVAAGLAQVAVISQQQPPSTAFRQGGIIEGRQDFSYNNQQRVRGYAGEAGPEAIVPLVRAPGGELGVRSMGGGGAGNTSSIVISPSVSVSVTVGADANGGAIGDAIGDEIVSIIDGYIQNELRPGGSLNQ